MGTVFAVMRCHYGNTAFTASQQRRSTVAAILTCLPEAISRS